MSAALNPWIERLAAALEQERQAILDHDVEALIRSTGDKLEALRRLESAMPAADTDGLEPRLAELSQLNHANGALLARRRREVNWALRHLGRSESNGAYDAHGQTNRLQVSRPLGVV